eukprot:244952-Prymnesium_polylepis.1
MNRPALRSSCFMPAPSPTISPSAADLTNRTTCLRSPLGRGSSWSRSSFGGSLLKSVMRRAF